MIPCALRDVDDGGRPLGAVDIFQFLEEDLDGLAVGRVLRDQVQAWGILDLCGRLVGVEAVGHGGLVDNVEGCDGMGWDGMGWDGMGWDGM
jgi:hypothetical protein